MDSVPPTTGTPEVIRSRTGGSRARTSRPMATSSRPPSRPQDVRAGRRILDVLLEQTPLALLRYLDAESVRRDQSAFRASACTTKDVRNSTEKPARRDGGRSPTQASSTDSRGLGTGNGNRLYFPRPNPLGSRRQYSSLDGFNDGNSPPNPLTARMWQVTPCAGFGDPITAVESRRLMREGRCRRKEMTAVGGGLERCARAVRCGVGPQGGFGVRLKSAPTAQKRPRRRRLNEPGAQLPAGPGRFRIRRRVGPLKPRRRRRQAPDGMSEVPSPPHSEAGHRAARRPGLHMTGSCRRRAPQGHHRLTAGPIRSAGRRAVPGAPLRAMPLLCRRRRPARRFAFTKGCPSPADDAGKGEAPTPFHSQRIAGRGACGKTRGVPHNRRPRPEAAETGMRGACGVVDTRVARAGRAGIRNTGARKPRRPERRRPQGPRPTERRPSWPPGSSRRPGPPAARDGAHDPRSEPMT